MNRIADYGLIGNCHSVALVGKDGTIDWACFPRFDSPAVFARMLDLDHGGAFKAWARGVRTTERAYLDDTNVLVTTMHTDDGVFEITDCMPVGESHHAILRRLRCTAGSVVAEVEVTPRYEYGAFAPQPRLTSETTGSMIGGADALWFTATRVMTIGGRERLLGTWELAEGDEVWLDMAWTEAAADPPPTPSEPELRKRLDATVAFWRDWLGQCRYDGEHKEEVHRSALVLKALTYAPTGAVVAAATTSLPEKIGGERNWDYRYTWIRDATLTLTALFVLGFEDEATAFKAYLERTFAGRPHDLQIMYGIGGERFLPEIELPHLPGHRGSRPVRVGNGAVKQLQLDCYGQLLEAAWLFRKAGGEITPDNWAFLSGLADIVVERWRQPDQGIWEIRDEPRHFVHSKLNCWVALDRAIRIADDAALPGNVEMWRRERDALRAYLLDEGAAAGWFSQAANAPTPDASTLLVPALGFLPTSHPAVLKTIDVVRRDLERDGLVHRYLAPDGIDGGEGAFLLCSFWLLDCLIHAEQLDDAEALLQRLLDLANDVGLYAEEIDTSTGEMLGNFPQAFTHMALVTTCAHLSAARRGLLPTDGAAHDYAELALDRLIAGRPAG